MTRDQVKELLDRVLAWSPEKQADLAHVIEAMEQDDRNRLRLFEEQAAEVRRRLADRDRQTIPAEELFYRFRSWLSLVAQPSGARTRFNFNESKSIEALLLIAERWPGITPFFLAKVLFFADRDHLRAYGRPITGDMYVAMADGPVPSHLYDLVKGNLDFFGNPEAVSTAVRVDRNERFARIYAERVPNLDLLSETDVAALISSIGFCRGKSFADLRSLTHQERAWIEAAANGEVDPELLVPEDMREEVREVAAYAVL